MCISLLLSLNLSFYDFMTLTSLDFSMDFKLLQRPNIDLFQTVIFQTFKLSYEQSFSLMTAGPLATTQSPNISLQLKNLQCLSPKAIHEFSGGCGSGGRAGRPPTGRSVDPCSLPVTVSEFPPVRVRVQMLDKALTHRKKCLFEWVCDCSVYPSLYLLFQKLSQNSD